MNVDLAARGRGDRASTGVRYHPAHVWSLLRQDLKWSWQRPARRAAERNDEAIHQWVKRRWPALKKGKAPERTDRVRGRIRRIPVAVGARDVGTQRPDTGAAPSELRPGAYNDQT
jgi:hypothetical protein